MTMSRRQLLKAGMIGAAGAALPLTLFKPGSAPAALQGFSTPLPLLPKARPVGANAYRIAARPGTQQFHPALGNTRMWGYDDFSGRGVRTPGVSMTTSRMLGCFLDDSRSRSEVLKLMGY